ncbi:Arrestin domain-containing protein 17 [Pseudolycoriella hygida]|uniref:Arrestin domain-containing protein 17 n=1 Tax=Pseudolycoriella hygida TaxID=35572 RepID=A0A9Q0MRE6_9DIPT|nr:Arrestin domain-containing protein 17 [Pseudolycoriella hygida]
MPTESVRCDILFDFDNSQRVITSGQSLSGQVVLTFFKPKYLLGIFMNVVGKATIKFSKGSARNKRIFAWEEIYIDEEIHLVNGGDFMPDVYSYPFECLLSADFPSSVESAYGNIRYYVNVVLLNSSWSDRTFKREFTLIKPLDLNLHEYLRFPVINKFVERFNLCCLLCCFKTDPLFVTAVIPCSGYTPTQIIALRIQVINESDQPIDKISVKFIQFFDYTDRHNSETVKVKENVLVEKGFTSPFERVEVYNVDIEVPRNVPPTDTTSSKVLKLSYKLRVHGKINDTCRSDVFLEIPVTIGTRPLLFSRSVATSPFQEIDSNSDSLLIAAANRTAELDPPTYDEAVIM